MGMQVGKESANAELTVMMEINTTPLIDVMLVLLIMLIITIPSQLHSVNLDMPVPTVTPKKVDPVVMKILVDERSVVHWNGKALHSDAELQTLLQQAASMQPQPELHIRSHAKAKYEKVMNVLASSQRLGLKKLGIVGSEQFVK